MGADIWQDGEGDRWWQRNAAVLSDPAHAAADPTLRLLDRLPPPKRVLEVGCANAWRLSVLHARYGCECSGVDVSREALTYGRAHYPELQWLLKYPAHSLPFAAGSYDVLVYAFVWHWIDRANLCRSVYEADRVLAPGGHLVITDFLPDRPTKVRYHHRPDVEAWTWKTDYAAIFTALGTYVEVGRDVFDHDTGQPGDCAPNVRAAAVALRKGEAYLCASPSSATAPSANATRVTP